MNNTIQKIGTCLCGEVKIDAKEININVGACHCASCRKWGGPLLSIDCGSKVSIVNKENVSIFDSSDWAERGFCKQCGSHLFYRLKQTNQYIIPVGLFEGEEFIFDHQIFIEEKPEYYCFANKTKNMTGAEVFAEFGAKL